jgi:ketosteroid isomerase-like protein
MSGNDALGLVSLFYERFDRGDIDDAVALFSEKLETTDPGMGTVYGLASFRSYLETFKRAMPDARALVEHIYEVDGTVIVEGRFMGTHTGPLSSPDGDVAPTGATVDLRFTDVSHVDGGVIVSYHTYYDQLGLLTQLGLMDEAA